MTYFNGTQLNSHKTPQNFPAKYNPDLNTKTFSSVLSKTTEN